MYPGIMREELEQFVASLAIPADRKAIVAVSLLLLVEGMRARRKAIT